MKSTSMGTLGILTTKPRFDVKTTYVYVIARLGGEDNPVEIIHIE